MQRPKSNRYISRGKQGAAWLSALLSALFCILSPAASASDQDSLRELSRDEFIAIVQQYHPVAKSAALQVQRAKAGILQGRGAFDPAIAADLSSKTLDGKLYYQYINPEVTIPTWYGLELMAGSEHVQGARLNPESTTGQLNYAGAKLNITGIWMDARRAALRQAEALARQTEAERLLALNQLLYDALAAYFSWQREWETLRIMDAALENARERYRYVTLEYTGGLRPAIDTVEAMTQLQSIALQRSGTELNYLNAAIEVSGFLWLSSGEPVPSLPAIRPAPASATPTLLTMPDLLAGAGSHPKLRALRGKLDAQEIDKRLKRSYLLPKMSVKASALSTGYSRVDDIGSAYLRNNNKVYADFRLPLFLREARGAYRAADLKIQETRLDIDLQELTILNKIRSYYNEVTLLQSQLTIARTALGNYQRLYEGERMKFEVGESTLFLLNSRQNKVIEGEQKVIEIIAKLRKAEAAAYHAAGLLFDDRAE